MSTLMAFDTSYVYFRAFFGVPDRFHAQDGRPVNAVRGTLDAIARLVDEYRPTHVACAWDEDWRPQWRTDLVETYKAHRVEVEREGGVDQEETPPGLEAQVPMIAETLEVLGIRAMGAARHEADDVLGSLADQFGGASLVVTGDRDLFQLVDDTTRVVYIGRGIAKHELVDAQWLTNSYGLTPGRYVDFSVLRGDPSDGLPGVKGIGEKSAAALVEAHVSLEMMLEAAHDPDSGMAKGLRSKLLDASDYLPRARRVVEVVRDLSLPEPPRLPATIDVERARELQEQWNLGGSMDRAIKALSTDGVQEIDG